MPALRPLNPWAPGLGTRLFRCLTLSLGSILVAPLENTYDIERKQRSVAMQPDAKLVQIEMLLSRAEALAVLEVAREITSRRNAA